MIKIFGCLMIFGGCTTLGFRYSKTLSTRVFELKELEKAVMILENEITYTYTELPDAFLKVSNELESPLSMVFKKAHENLISTEFNDIHDSLINALEEEEDKLSLDKKDKNIIIQLSKSLGQWDIEAHKNLLKLCRKNIEEQIQVGTRKEMREGKMFKTLGISLGAIICILLL